MAINNYAARCVESGDGRPKPPRIQHLNTEAFAAGAASLRVRVRELESAGDELRRVVELRALQVEGRPWVDDDGDAGRPDKDVAALRLGREPELVAQPVASAARNRDPEVFALLLAGHQGSDLVARRLREADKALAPLPDGGRGGRRR